MGLFRKPLTTEESEQQARYEASKLRLMDLHTKASLLFYNMVCPCWKTELSNTTTSTVPDVVRCWPFWFTAPTPI